MSPGLQLGRINTMVQSQSYKLTIWTRNRRVKVGAERALMKRRFTLRPVTQSSRAQRPAIRNEVIYGGTEPKGGYPAGQ